MNIGTTTSSTWVQYDLPRRARYLWILTVAAGGSGGGGRSASTDSSGGGGGAAGSVTSGLYLASRLPSTIWVRTGSFQPGGAANTAGAQGGPSFVAATPFSTGTPILPHLIQRSGNGGSGGAAGTAGADAAGGTAGAVWGTTDQGLGAAARLGMFNRASQVGGRGLRRANGESVAAVFGTNNAGVTRSGAGGGGTNSGAAFNGGDQTGAAAHGSLLPTIAGGAGAATGGAGRHGIWQVAGSWPYMGYGGTGGGNATGAGTGGAGGDGAPGCGGGGGGSSNSGTAGAGGAGGPGYAILIPIYTRRVL
jgi:hypothetical protein